MTNRRAERKQLAVRVIALVIAGILAVGVLLAAVLK